MKLDPKFQPWMRSAEVQAVLAALGGEARFVGGAVRNALMNRPIDDVDLATPLTPDVVMQKLRAADINAVPTGIEHGTVTAVTNGQTFEVTTLRRDVSTDGRRAVVAFTTDWKEDASRRDFTMNALYANTDGELFDYFGGLDDLKARHVRFIGDATQRIREDYLRILRLFRFHAWYGTGEIDAEALRASAAEKAGLAQLSGERISKEMLKLLAADEPVPVLRVMAASGILSEVLPGELNFTRLEKLAANDADAFLTPDPLLRLVALLPSDPAAAEALAARWRLSNAQSDRLTDVAGAREKIVSYLSVKEVRRLLYRLGPARMRDRLYIKWAEDPKVGNVMQWRALIAMADDHWPKPQFPLTGRDVMLAGVPQGPLVGEIMKEVEDWWIDADFIEDEFSIAERLKAVVQATAY
ncbi:MAG TPA: CCA tRNA nucleotidyltransferase [Rhizomicrobium sp.]|nr:CCA tRNA nucleotidyltransferase [Rhizomicrobium sp.]